MASFSGTKSLVADSTLVPIGMDKSPHKFSKPPMQQTGGGQPSLPRPPPSNRSTANNWNKTNVTNGEMQRA